MDCAWMASTATRVTAWQDTLDNFVRLVGGHKRPFLHIFFFVSKIIFKKYQMLTIKKNRCANFTYKRRQEPANSQTYCKIASLLILFMTFQVVVYIRLAHCLCCVTWEWPCSKNWNITILYPSAGKGFWSIQSQPFFKTDNIAFNFRHRRLC